MHKGLHVQTPSGKLPTLQSESPYTHTETDVSDASCQAGDYPPLRSYRQDVGRRPRPLSLTPCGHRRDTVSPEIPDYISALRNDTPLQRVSAIISSPVRPLRNSFEMPALPKKLPLSTYRLQRCLYPRSTPLNVQGFNPRHRNRSRWLSMRGSPHFCLITPVAPSTLHRGEKTRLRSLFA